MEKKTIKSEHYPLPSHLQKQRGKDISVLKDKQLVDLIKQGDRKAAEELVERYYSGIYMLMRRFGYNIQTSEDLTQESFMKVWSHINQLRKGGSLKSWLYKVALNVSRSHLRKNFWRKHADANELQLSDGNEDGDVLEKQEELKKLRDEVAKLKQKLKETIVLHYLQGLTIEESAEAAGIKTGTFKSRLNRALNILKEQMNSNWNKE